MNCRSGNNCSAANNLRENAVKHTFNPATRTWTTCAITVSLAARPFQQGTMRRVYEMIDYSLPQSQQQCVAKVSKDINEPRQTYFNESEMQHKCKEFAQRYNCLNPPKRIDFVDSWVVEFTNRAGPNGRGKMVALVEPMLRGYYTKHSNNFGFVSPEDRNTPQAFSHWTWVVSGGRQLVCDIQGVGDTFTDPQIHSNAGHRNYLYGRGDMGIEGIQHFFATHRCNGICRSLGLPTTPATEMMGPRRECGTAVRCRPCSPAFDYIGAFSSNYSSPSSSPASSVGGLSSVGLCDPFSRPLVEHRLIFPQLSALPVFI